MSDKQRKNSKRFNSSPRSRSLIKKSKKKLLRMHIGEPYRIDMNAELPSQQAYFQEVVCKTDSIIHAKVKSKASQLSGDKKKVFTDYELEIKSVIKNASSKKLQIGGLVTLTRSGGAVELDNQVIDLTNASYKRLFLNEEYLFFVNYLADSDSFIGSDVEGTMETEATKLKRFSDILPRYIEANIDLPEFVSILMNLHTRCGSTEVK